MKWMVASDLHGSAYYCRKLLAAFEAQGADRLVLLGDILYHGPRNDLPEGYAPKEVISLLNPIKDKLLAVRGNCEAEVDQMVLDFPVMADYAVLDLGSRLVYVTHGHKFNIDNPLPMKEGDVMIYGHTHVVMDEVKEGRRYLNPGSVSIPKMGTGRGYIIIENDTFTWKALD